MKRKYLALLTLMILLALSLSSCGFSSLKDKESISSDLITENPILDQKDEAEKLIGKIEDDVYINDYLNLAFVLPDEWSFYDYDTYQNMLDIAQEFVLGENDPEKVSSEIPILNAKASLTSAYSGHSVNMIMHKLTPAEKKIPADVYIQELLSGSSKFDLSENMTAEYSATKITVADKEYDAVHGKCNIEVFDDYAVTANIYQVIIIEGDYLYFLAIGGSDEEYLLYLTESFCKVEDVESLKETREPFELQEETTDYFLVSGTEVMGTIDGNIYLNETLGLGFVLPDNWFYVDAESDMLTTERAKKLYDAEYVEELNLEDWSTIFGAEGMIGSNHVGLITLSVRKQTTISEINAYSAMKAYEYSKYDPGSPLHGQISENRIIEVEIAGQKYDAVYIVTTSMDHGYEIFITKGEYVFEIRIISYESDEFDTIKKSIFTSDDVSDIKSENAVNETDTELNSGQIPSDEVLGRVYDDYYENDNLGIGFKFPHNDWVYIDSNYLELTEKEAKDLYDIEYAEYAVENNTEIFGAQSNGLGIDVGCSVLITARIPNEIMKENIDNLPELLVKQYDNTQLTTADVMQAKVIDVEITGETYPAFYCEMNSEEFDLSVYSIEVFISKNGYVYDILVQAYDKESAYSALEYFYSL